MIRSLKFMVVGGDRTSLSLWGYGMLEGKVEAVNFFEPHEQCDRMQT